MVPRIRKALHDRLILCGGLRLWNVWEGSFRYGRQGVDIASPRSDPRITYPLVEYMHADSLFLNNVAVTGVHLYRGNAVFHRVLLRLGGAEPKTSLQIIRDKNAVQGKSAASRADLQFGASQDGRVFLINKGDGTIRVLVP